jgi:L-Ala-D/L-Glu epimerase
MQITHAEVIPIDLNLAHPARSADLPLIKSITAIFLRLDLQDGRSAWGAAVAHPGLTGETPEAAVKACWDCAARAVDLHPTNIEYSLAELAPVMGDSPAARCAFDLAFYDLLGLAAGIPLYRLLGGFRNRIQTSATVPLGSVQESVEVAERLAAKGFKILKIKGGEDPEADVRRARAIHRALPYHLLRLDADGGYSLKSALEVARALEKELEFLEQPTPPDDLESLVEVTRSSPVPILADQSVSDPVSALVLAGQKAANGLSLKMATCGGVRCAQQIDAIARAAKLTTLVGCVIEPALMIAAGLSFALASPNVRYCDLDGHLDLVNDPTVAGFRLEEGWLTASEVPGLGCRLEV